MFTWRRSEIDSPEAWSSGFLVPLEYLATIFVVHFQFVFVNVCSAICIAQLTQAEEVVGKSGDDVC